MKQLPKFNHDSYAHFVTAATYRHRPHFTNETFAAILLDELRFYSNRYEVALIGYVIMPDHFHAIMWWDSDQKLGLTISKLLQGIKGVSARCIIDLAKSRGEEHPLLATPEGASGNPNSRNLRYRFWQPGFYDFNIETEEKLLEKLNYVHRNPVTAGLAPSPCAYDWSSYRDYAEDEGSTMLQELSGAYVQTV